MKISNWTELTECLRIKSDSSFFKTKLKPSQTDILVWVRGWAFIFSPSLFFIFLPNRSFSSLHMNQNFDKGNVEMDHLWFILVKTKEMSKWRRRGMAKTGMEGYAEEIRRVGEERTSD